MFLDILNVILTLWHAKSNFGRRISLQNRAINPYCYFMQNLSMLPPER